MGGEPTFVGRDHPDSPQWNAAALGPEKRELAESLIRGLIEKLGSWAMLHFGQGKRNSQYTGCVADSLRSGPYRLFFYSADNHEPPHEDISIESLLAGRRSGETQPLLRRWLASRVH